MPLIRLNGVRYLFIGFFLSLSAQSAIAQVYPSAGIAWVVPGAYSPPTQPDYLAQFSTAAAVRQWELEHADLILGGRRGTLKDDGPYILGYMYNQKLEFTPTPLEMYLRKAMEARNLDYESLFLHFSEDTRLHVQKAGDGQLTPFGRIPSIVGWTEQPDHAGFLVYETPPYDKPVWENHKQQGGLYVLLFEPFDRLYIDLSSTAGNGELVVEYPSSSVAGFASGWEPLVIEDDTDNLRRSGEVRWQPPADWQRTSTHDGSRRTYGGGPYFGNPLLRDGGRYYAVRLLWRNGSGPVPRLKNVLLKDWMPEVLKTGANQRPITGGVDKGQVVTGAKQPASMHEATGQIRIIPGWDSRNDQNGDGYVDKDEWANLANPYARARFKYESRVVPLGRMWSVRSSWCRPNLLNPLLGTLLAEYYKKHWSQEWLSGAYNDDLYRLLQKEFTLVSGGRLLEYDGVVTSDATERSYHTGFINTLSTLREGTGSILGANISMVNLWSGEGGAGDFLPAFSVFLREGYIRPSLGLSGWFGLNRTWDTFALAARGRWSILMAMANRGSRVSREGNTRSAWETDIESSLAQFYLLNVPGKTYFHMWNRWFSYGSGNTTAANFYQAGIPKNMAYHPRGLLQADIGKPLSYLKSGQQAVAYMKKTTESDYTIIGDSADSQLVHSSFVGGSLTVIPSNLFYLWRSAEEIVPGGPTEMILAREYSRGLVLYRTDFFGHSAEFQQSISAPVVLPGWYQRVFYDGSRSEPINSISLAGYEGAILTQVD